MSSPKLTHEQLRDLGKALSAQFPDGLLYALVVWPAGQPLDTGYFSNSHRSQSLVAMKTLLGALQARGGALPEAKGGVPLSLAERGVLEAAGCGWVLDRIAQKEIVTELLYADLKKAWEEIKSLEADLNHWKEISRLLAIDKARYLERIACLEASSPG